MCGDDLVDPIGVANAETAVGEGDNCRLEAVFGSRIGKFNESPFACRLEEAADLARSRVGLEGETVSISELVQVPSVAIGCKDIGRALGAMTVRGTVGVTSSGYSTDCGRAFRRIDLSYMTNIEGYGKLWL